MAMRLLHTLSCWSGRAMRVPRARFRPNRAAFARCFAQMCRWDADALRAGLLPATPVSSLWTTQKGPKQCIKQRSGSAWHWRLSAAWALLPVVTPRANRLPLAPLRGPLARLSFKATCSPVLPSALLPISSIVKNTRAAANARITAISFTVAQRAAARTLGRGVFAFRPTSRRRADV